MSHARFKILAIQIIVCMTAKLKHTQLDEAFSDRQTQHVYAFS
jgi:hypothetical protein